MKTLGGYTPFYWPIHVLSRSQRSSLIPFFADSRGGFWPSSKTSHCHIELFKSLLLIYRI